MFGQLSSLAKTERAEMKYAKLTNTALLCPSSSYFLTRSGTGI